MAGSPIGDASVKITGDTTGFEGALSKISGLAAATGAKISSHLGGAFTAVAAAAAPVAIVGGLLKIGSTFDEAFDKIRVQTGATGQQFENLQGSFKTVFAGVPASADDVSTAVGTLQQRLGLTGAPLETLSTQLLNLSHITGTDLKSNLDATSGLFVNWGVAAGDQGPKLDELFRASQATGVSVAELASTMSSSGVVLRDVGLNFEQSAALIGVLGKAGLDAGSVMPALAKSMATAAKQGKDAGTLFRETFAKIKDTGISDTQAAGEAMAVFGAKAGPKLSALIREGKLSYDDLAKSIASGGDTISAATAATEDFPEKFKKFSHQAQVALEPLASAVFSFAGNLLEKLGPALQHVSSLISDKVGPVVNTVVAGFKGMGSAFSGEGVTSSGFVGAMERIGVAAREVFDRLKSIDWAAVFAQAKDWIMPVVDALVNVGRAVADLAVAVATFIADHWDQIKSAFETVADIARGALTTALTTLGGIIKTVADNFNVFGPAILTVVTAIIAYKAALAGLDAVHNAVKRAQDLINAGKTVYHNLLRIGAAAQKVYTAAQWLLNAAMSANPIALVVIGIAALVAGFILAYKHIKPFHDAVDAIGRVIKGVVTGAIDFFVDHWQLLAAILLGGPIGVAVLFIIRHFDTLKDAVVGAVTWILNKLGEFLGFFISLPGSILAALAGAASWLLQAGVDLITGLYNGVVSAVGTVTGWFAGLAGMVLGWVGDATIWLLGTGAQIFAGFLQGLYSAESTIVGFFLGIGGSIASWVGDLSWVLVHAGVSVIEGLWDGISSKLGWLAEHLGQIAPLVAGSKGPIEKDRQILHPAGQAIMEGLMAGIAETTPHLAAQLSGVSGLIGGTGFGFGGVGGGFGLPGPGGGLRVGGGGSSVNNSRTWQAGAVQINIPAQGSPEATAMAVSRRLAMGVAA